MKNPLILAVLLTAGLYQACGPGQNDDKDKPVDKDGTGDPNTAPKDEEDETALEPVEVTGAFLTGSGPATGEAIPAKAGFRPVGLNVYLAKTGVLVTDPVSVLSLTFTNSKGEASVVEPEKISGYTAWQAVVFLPEETPDPIPDAVVDVSIDESKKLSITNIVAGVARDADGDNGNSIDAVQDAPSPLENVTEHRIFVTNGRYKPGVDFSNVLDANKLCNKEAKKDAGLVGFWWKAVLADEDQTIDQRIPLYGPVKNLLGEQLIPAGTVLANAVLPAGSLQFANFGTAGSGITTPFPAPKKTAPSETHVKAGQMQPAAPQSVVRPPAKTGSNRTWHPAARPCGSTASAARLRKTRIEKISPAPAPV